MTNPTQPTPEQLAKWRKEFERNHVISLVEINPSGMYVARRVEWQWKGYLRAKQENEQEITQLKADIANALQALTDTAIVSEQAMKLAKFGAMTLHSEILMYHSYETITDAIACSLLVEDAHHGDTIYGVDYAPNIEATIKELLK